MIAGLMFKIAMLLGAVGLFFCMVMLVIARKNYHKWDRLLEAALFIVVAGLLIAGVVMVWTI
jgi:NADH:ubiquinone oxidoreductase subunit 6 (subunit J)